MISIADPIITWRERLAVDRVMRSRKLAQGDEVKKFEESFSSNVENKLCVAVNSGTSGLLLAMLASGIGPGDEVIVPSFTFAATANTVALTGAKPVFVDINPETYNLDPKAVEASITSKTKGIQPVHLYGLPADMFELKVLAEKYNLLIFEDAAQAHLASINGKNVGTFGDTATFSFYPTKNITSGEGGMIVCNNQEVARKCRLLRNQGMEKRYENEIIGFNMRMTDIHAAIGRVQLFNLHKWTGIRQANAAFLNKNLTGVVTPKIPEGYTHVFHQYTIRVKGHDRDRFAEELGKRGISTGIYYPKPTHKLDSFHSKLDLPNTNEACKEVLSLPVHPRVKKSQLEKIVQAVNSIAQGGA